MSHYMTGYAAIVLFQLAILAIVGGSFIGWAWVIDRREQREYAEYLANHREG